MLCSFWRFDNVLLRHYRLQLRINFASSSFVSYLRPDWSIRVLLLNVLHLPNLYLSFVSGSNGDAVRYLNAMLSRVNSFTFYMLPSVSVLMKNKPPHNSNWMCGNWIKRRDAELILPHVKAKKTSRNTHHTYSCCAPLLATNMTLPERTGSVCASALLLQW
jgi:hypothetical protein